MSDILTRPPEVTPTTSNGNTSDPDKVAHMYGDQFHNGEVVSGEFAVAFGLPVVALCGYRKTGAKKVSATTDLPVCGKCLEVNMMNGGRIV